MNVFWGQEREENWPYIGMTSSLVFTALWNKNVGRHWKHLHIPTLTMNYTLFPPSLQICHRCYQLTGVKGRWTGWSLTSFCYSCLFAKEQSCRQKWARWKRGEVTLLCIHPWKHLEKAALIMIMMSKPFLLIKHQWYARHKVTWSQTSCLALTKPFWAKVSSQPLYILDNRCSEKISDLLMGSW